MFAVVHMVNRLVMSQQYQTTLCWCVQPFVYAKTIFKHNPYDDHQNFLGAYLHATWFTKVKYGYPTPMKMDDRWLKKPFKMVILCQLWLFG